MLHKATTAERSVLEVVDELYRTVRARVHAQLAEHTLTQVVNIILKDTFLLSILGFHHLRNDLNRSVGTSHLTKLTGDALVIAFSVLRHDKASAVTRRYVKGCLPVLRILLGDFLREIFTESDAKSCSQRLQSIPLVIITRLSRLSGIRYFHSSLRIWSIRKRGYVHFIQSSIQIRKNVLAKNHTIPGM